MMKNIMLMYMVLNFLIILSDLKSLISQNLYIQLAIVFMQ